MLENLGNGGMNCPLSDSEDSIDKELQRCEHFWLSTEIISLFEVLDSIERRAHASKLITRRGNRPLRINNKPVKRVLDSPVTPSLPRNWYREEWYNHLDLYERIDIRAAKNKALPDIVSVPACFYFLVLIYFLSKRFGRLLKVEGPLDIRLNL
jgi:hypothetical protein